MAGCRHKAWCTDAEVLPKSSGVETTAEKWAVLNSQHRSTLAAQFASESPATALSGSFEALPSSLLSSEAADTAPEDLSLPLASCARRALPAKSGLPANTSHAALRDAGSNQRLPSKPWPCEVPAVDPRPLCEARQQCSEVRPLETVVVIWSCGELEFHPLPMGPSHCKCAGRQVFGRPRRIFRTPRKEIVGHFPGHGWPRLPSLNALTQVDGAACEFFDAL